MRRAVQLIVVCLLGLVFAPPAGAAEVEQFGVGAHHSCALTSAGKAKCWGGDPSYAITDEPKAEFKQLSVGNYHVCGLKRSGRATCWGDSSIDSTKAPGEWRRIEAGYYATCGIRPTGRVACFGYEPYRDGIPGGRFRSVSLGGDFACGLRPSGTVACWGDGEDGQTMAPAGEFRSLTTGAQTACAQKRSGRLSCWGSNEDGLVGLLDGKVAGPTRVGDANYCALPRGGGSLICGGDPSRPVSDPPPGRFTGVDLYAYGDHSCAVRRDRSLACWGDNFFGETDVPRAFLPSER